MTQEEEPMHGFVGPDDGPEETVVSTENEAAPQSRRFIIEVSVSGEVPDPMDAADELLDFLTSATLPAWVFSVDGIDPQEAS